MVKVDNISLFSVVAVCAWATGAAASSKGVTLEDIPWSSVAIAANLNNLPFRGPSLGKHLCGNDLEVLLQHDFDRCHWLGLVSYRELTCTSTDDAINNATSGDPPFIQKKRFKFRLALLDFPEKGYDPSSAECLHLFKLEAIQRENPLIETFIRHLPKLSYSRSRFPRGYFLDTSGERLESALCISEFIQGGIPLQYHVANLKSHEELLGFVFALLDLLDALSHVDIIHRDVHYDNIVVRKLSNVEAKELFRQRQESQQSGNEPGSRKQQGPETSNTQPFNGIYYELILMDFTWATSPGIRNYAAIPPYLNIRYALPHCVSNSIDEGHDCHNGLLHDDVYSVGLLLSNILSTLTELDVSWLQPLIELMTDTSTTAETIETTRLALNSSRTAAARGQQPMPSSDSISGAIYRDGSGRQFNPPHRLQHSRKSIRQMAELVIELYLRRNQTSATASNSAESDLNGDQLSNSVEERHRELLCNHPNMYASQLSLRKLYVVPQEDYGRKDAVMSPHAVVTGYQHFEMTNFLNGQKRDNIDSSKSMSNDSDYIAQHTQLKPLSQTLLDKDLILRSFIENVSKGLTVFDVGGNMGFFAARTVQFGANRAFLIDMDAQYTAAAVELYEHMGSPFAQKISVVNSKLSDISSDMLLPSRITDERHIDVAQSAKSANTKFSTKIENASAYERTPSLSSSEYRSSNGTDSVDADLKVGKQIGDGLVQADIVIALALVHWSFNCSESYGSLARTIGGLARRTRKWLIIEWIDPDDSAIKFANHLGSGSISNSSNVERNFRRQSPYTLDEFIRVLQNIFDCVHMLGCPTPTRCIYFAKHKYIQSPHDAAVAAAWDAKYRYHDNIFEEGSSGETYSRGHEADLAAGDSWARKNNFCL